VPNGWLVNGPGQATQGYNLKTEAKVKKKDDSKAKESKPADSTVAKEAPKEAKPKSSKKEDDDDFLLKW
jgi:hypothetical protein